MTAPPLKGHNKTCASKRRYPCELTARAAAMDSIERNGNAKVLGVYRCPYCNGWHLTRQVGDYAVTSADPVVPVIKVRKKL